MFYRRRLVSVAVLGLGIPRGFFKMRITIYRKLDNDRSSVIRSQKLNTLKTPIQAEVPDYTNLAHYLNNIFCDFQRLQYQAKRLTRKLPQE